MEISHGLLVAIMFVVLLSMGIGTLLAGLAGAMGQGSPSRIHASWLVLLLLVYFNLFWHTLDVLSIEDWGFAGFLYIVAGPILLFFATTVLVPGDNAEVSGVEAFFAISRRFFTTLAAVQLWVIGSDFLLQKGFTAGGALNALAFVLAAVLASTHNVKTHTVGAAIAWLLFLTTVALGGLGLTA